MIFNDRYIDGRTVEFSMTKGPGLSIICKDVNLGKYTSTLIDGRSVLTLITYLKEYNVW